MLISRYYSQPLSWQFLIVMTLNLVISVQKITPIPKHSLNVLYNKSQSDTKTPHLLKYTVNSNNLSYNIYFLRKINATTVLLCAIMTVYR